MHFCKKNLHVWEKMPIEGAIHLRSHNIPLRQDKTGLHVTYWTDVSFTEDITDVMYTEDSTGMISTEL